MFTPCKCRNLTDIIPIKLSSYSHHTHQTPHVPIYFHHTHHTPIMDPFCSHHAPIILPSRTHPAPITHLSCTHHTPITLPSHSHHSPISLPHASNTSIFLFATVTPTVPLGVWYICPFKYTINIP